MLQMEYVPVEESVQPGVEGRVVPAIVHRTRIACPSRVSTKHPESTYLYRVYVQVVVFHEREQRIQR